MVGSAVARPAAKLFRLCRPSSRVHAEIARQDLRYAIRSLGRTREIGVRIAVGARSRDILGMVMGRSALLAGFGVTIGAAVAYAAGRSRQALLAGIDPADARVFSTAIGLSLLMTLAGSALPAWRAVRVDPLTATRSE